MRICACLIGLVLLVGCGGSGGGDDGGVDAQSACSLLDGTVITTTEAGCATFLGTFHPGLAAGDVAPPVPTKAAIGQQAQTMELLLRDQHGLYLKTVGILGREFWNLNGVDPEYTGALMGKNGAALPADSPLLTTPFLHHYRLVQLSAILIRAADAATELSSMEVRAVKGYARTLQAYMLLLVLNRQFSHGILPVTSLEFPSASNFLDYSMSLQHIFDLLDEGAIHLTNAGAAFPFSLTPGFSGFDTPATFRQFNRALSARARLYNGDKPGALSGLAGSFFNFNGSMDTGPRLFYDTAFPNPMHFAPGVDLFTAHPDWVADAALGDTNPGQKSAAFGSVVSHDGLAGDRQVALYAALDNLPIVRNEELILIYAETQIGSDVNEVLAAINKVRNAHGLGVYLGATSDAALLDQVLERRRYGLFGEGHRWIDMRRTGKFGQINIDRPGDVAHQELPRPGAATLQQIALP